MGDLFPHIRKDFKVKSSDTPPFRAERIHFCNPEEIFYRKH
jgi:hypothetical protein